MQDDEFYNYLKNPILFPESFKDWISDYLATNIPKLHVSQIFGFKLQSVKDAAEVTAQENNPGTSYAAGSTPGPTLDNVSNGMYIALFGATFGTTGGVPAYDNTTQIYMALSVDGAAPSDSDAAILNAGSNGRVTLIDLTSGDHQHSVTAQYRRVGASTTRAVWNRWLYLIKVVTEDA